MAMNANSQRKLIKLLPEEVIRDEIFTRLPVKSLLRCKSVSKSWLSLISEPKFAKDHHDNCVIKSPNDFDCLVAHKERDGLVILSRHEEETCMLPHDYGLCGSIHGLILICMSNGYSLDHDYQFWLWNPAIRQSKEFTLSPWIDRRPYFSQGIIGFGFDPVCNDYKVVVCRFSDGEKFAFVYSSNSDEWSYVTFPDYLLRANRFHSYAIVKDCPYWTYFITCSPDKQFVPLVPVKFDTTTNEFKLLPKFMCKVGKHIILVNMMDRPTLMEYEHYSRNLSLDVYSLDEEETGVWSKIFTVERPIDDCSRSRDPFQGLRHGHGIVFSDYRGFFYYDHETDKISDIPGKCSHSVSRCFRYTPSLVCLDGMELDTKSDTPLSRLISSLRNKSCPSTV